jgi:hypothetical protein
MDIKRVFQWWERERIMVAVNSRSSCRPIFKAFKMLTIASQYILTLMTCLAHNLANFTFGNSLHGICPRRRLQLHRPAANIVSYLRVVHYTTTKIFNILPKCGADWMADKHQFVQWLRNLLIEQSFNYINEFVDCCVTPVQWLCYESCIIFCTHC